MLILAVSGSLRSRSTTDFGSPPTAFLQVIIASRSWCCTGSGARRSIHDRTRERHDF